MTRVIVTPADHGAALPELKSWLAISTDRDDALLTGQIQAALALFEQFAGVVPLRQTCQEVLGAHRRWQRLAAAPVIEVDDVRALGPDGDRPLLPQQDYACTFAPDGAAQVLLRRGLAQDRLLVRYTAGLAPDWPALDPAIRQGVIRLAAHYYVERASTQDASPPAAVVALWRPWRRVQLR
ncbi:phage head-tail connector protein [Porphyrobacter sp. GA68]|uniref:head-tail connector protein n=1 Tax=Porphyrobacter sp. GA68 TaxID=2883480 RepID=UPI001D19582D|nr:phage head-tail connector protein [Porphyrobacter sp. GA68]